MGLIIACFVVGLIFLMLFSQEGRGCLGGLIGLMFVVAGITVLGALLLGGGLVGLGWMLN